MAEMSDLCYLRKPRLKRLKWIGFCLYWPSFIHSRGSRHCQMVGCFPIRKNITQDAVIKMIFLKGAHTEWHWQRLIQVNGDTWEWVWDQFSSGTIHSNETLLLTLPLTLPLPLVCSYPRVQLKEMFYLKSLDH